MIRLRPSGADEVLIKRVRDWYEPGPGVFIAPQALFSPALLFTTGVNGAWYDPSDLNTLFQDAAGTTPVTAVEQPVGLMLDKSKGLVLGSNVSQVASATYTTYQDTTIAVGLSVTKNYLITFSYSLSSGSLSLQGDFLQSPYSSVSGNGTYSAIVRGGTFINIHAGPATGTATNISVRELSGNHAFNSSGNSANFPVLSARYNGLVTTENLTGNSWVLGGAASRTATTFTATSSGDFLYQTGGSYLGSVASGVGLTASVELSGTGIITFAILNGGGVDIGAQQITLTSTPTRYSISAGNTATGVNVGVTFRGTGTLVSANLSKVDFRLTNDAINQPAYQRVNTATDYDTVGFKPYLKFNGVNQWLQTNSIDFSYGDKMFVCAGVRKLSDAAAGIAVELSANATSGNPGAFALTAPPNTLGTFAFRSGGTTSGLAYIAGYAAPITKVLSGLGDISGDQAVLRINSAQAATDTSDQGTGNYGNYPLYIGARAGTSLWFNGRLHQLVVAGKQASASEISSTESYINTKTGAY